MKKIGNKVEKDVESMHRFAGDDTIKLIDLPAWPVLREKICIADGD